MHCITDGNHGINQISLFCINVSVFEFF